MAKAISDEAIDRLKTLLACGRTLKSALRGMSLSPYTLYKMEEANPVLKREIHKAAVAGTRLHIDGATQKALTAKTRDQALIARIGVEAAIRRAETLMRNEYGKQSQPLLSQPHGDGKLTISWQANPIAPEPIQITSKPAQTLEASPQDVHWQALDQDSTEAQETSQGEQATSLEKQEQEGREPGSVAAPAHANDGADLDADAAAPQQASH